MRGLHLDTRIFGQPIWTICDEKELMQVPDQMRKAVVFLYGTRKGERVPFGTAFFAAYPLPENLGNPGLLITANHVIAALKTETDDRKVLIRINTREGPATWIKCDVDEWEHPDTRVDFAYMPWSYDETLNADMIGWLLGAGTLTDAVIREQEVGLGDEVFMIGLFRNHLGRDRNEPILRVGNIAALPADPIKTRLGDMRAVLVEARSIGGLSGSPVFVHMGFSRWREGRVMGWTPSDGASTGPFAFLGLMHGHWDALDTETDRVGDGEKVNMGIGIVVPAEQIMEALRPTMEAVVRFREDEQEKNKPALDTVHEREPETEYDRFEDLARKLLHTPKPKADEQPGETS
jgi:hypothetical protein